MSLKTNEIMEYLAEPKEFVEERLAFPPNQDIAKLNGKGINTRAEYLVDINRKQCCLVRITFQNRIEEHEILLRLDIKTKPHRNPDGEVIDRTHLHIYREDYRDAWAYNLEDPRILDFLPNFNPAALLEAIELDTNENDNKLAIFDEFTNICHFNHINAIMYTIF